MHKPSFIQIMLAGISLVIGAMHIIKKEKTDNAEYGQNGALFHSANNGFTCITAFSFKNCHETSTELGSFTTVTGNTSGDAGFWADPNTSGQDFD